MYPIGICTSLANVAVLQAAGADFVEENLQDFLKPEQPDFNVQPTDLPVRAANCLLPGALKCVGPVVDLAQLKSYAGTAFQRAHQAGIEVIAFGSGDARKIPEGFPKNQAEEQFVAYLQTIAPLAAQQSITIVVEPINRAECNFINSIPEAAALVAACNHPNIQILADLYHMLRDGQTADDIRHHGPQIRHVHIAEKTNRTAPGSAGDDFRPFLKALDQVKYRGAISIEAHWNDLPTEAGRAIAELRRQLRAV